MVDRKECGMMSLEKIQTLHDDVDDTALTRLNIV